MPLRKRFIHRNQAPRRRIAILATIASAVALTLPMAASADPYWFFQGYLPLSDGTRQVFHDSCNCPNLLVRMSFQCGSKTMRQVFIYRSNYSWTSIDQSAWDCDDYTAYPYDVFVKAGCQNPPIVPYIFVYTNCRVGNGL
jgi:hypothetical protein